MRVLITGGAGFIGSHLSDRFLDEGHDVIAMDNLITGNTDNIAHLSGHPRFKYIHHDVTNYIFIPGPLDAILHFASPASPIDYLELPIQTLKVGSLGTHNALGLAKEKGARLLLASTSEVYGDPQVHPQPETYWGHVNPIGPRGVYDEAKRFAEAITMAYHTFHGVETRIVRIFNSIMADETVVVFEDDVMRIVPIEQLAAEMEQQSIKRPRRLYVPAFNPRTCQVELRLANNLIKHAAMQKDAYKITTRYGRTITVTGDHSVFRRNAHGEPEAIPVRQLSVDDHVAISAALPVIEKDWQHLNIAEHLIKTSSSEQHLWEYALVAPTIKDIIAPHKELICQYLMTSPRFDGSANKRNTVGCAWRKYCAEGLLPLSVVALLWRHGLWQWPQGARIRPYVAGATISIHNNIQITPDLLWVLGLYIAEGCLVAHDGDYRLLLSSDTAFVDRAAHLLEEHFGVQPRILDASPERSPSMYVNSKMLVDVFRDIFEVTGMSREMRIPAWMMQLPLPRLKYVLEGYRHGDGTHTNYEERRELVFCTTSEGLATDLIYVLMRFGLVASTGQYQTFISNRPEYEGRQFTFHLVTICEVDDFNILNWDSGVRQRLNATRNGDLIWAKVRSITPVQTTEYVYDFSVDDYENFVAGNGVFAHNTYGPRMRLADGRVVPNFIQQALRGEPLTVYGDGQQTRSFQYVSDLVEGLYRLLHSDEVEPVNIGNPHEFTIRDFAEIVNEITANPAGIVVKPELRIKDDPQNRQPDISKAKRVLGWEPQVLLREGLERTIPWFREQLIERGEISE